MIAPERLANALSDRYLLEHQLGHGGMAVVYLAQDLRHGRPVALKILRPEIAAALGPERFILEIRLTARLDHPHILPVLDSGEGAGVLWYTMPYVRGETLRQQLRRVPRPPLEDALELASQVAGALAYAHREGVIHRDLKPENILIAEGHARVGDFGVARALSAAGNERITEAGFIVGTPAYMSPEQAAGEPDIDGRSDVYSLGCILYEMLAGEPPFSGITAQALIAQRLTGQVPAVRRRQTAIPPELDRVVGRALALNPADRYASAAALDQALREAARDMPPALKAWRRLADALHRRAAGGR